MSTFRQPIRYFLRAVTTRTRLSISAENELGDGHRAGSSNASRSSGGLRAVAGGSFPRLCFFLPRVATVVVLVALVILRPSAQAIAAEADEPAESFPFVISYDTPQNITNISEWLPKPAGGDGFIRAVEGRFVTDHGPIRFWATNLCFDACFPSHRQAERVATRIARFGINCVRMHHMDSRSIWGSSPNKTTIDPEQLDRLDYLIYQLKQHGVYTNINLHVSRTLGEADGFPHADRRPKYDKGLGNFEPRMIKLQKKYARDLLTHVNPYTKTPYTDEPAVAMVEISNEDALFAIWNRGDLDDLPDPYATTYRRLWNAWLKGKYGTTERLRKAWDFGTEPLGDELLADPDFTQPIGKAWRIQTDERSRVDATVLPDGPEDNPALRVDIKQMGLEPWIPQLLHDRLTVEKGRAYTLSGYVRCSDARHIRVNCMMNHQPWHHLGLSSRLEAGKQWNQFQLTFVAMASDERARITFSDFKPGVYEFSGISFRPGGVVGLAEKQRLKDSSVAPLAHRNLNVSPAARKDFADFLWDTEKDYWWGMYRFLKDELKVRSLVSGTQLNYSPVHIQAGLDYLDAHAYWHHPTFPGRPWDSKNWYVRNRALVNASDGGTLSRLAVRRVADMAYTVSEYNHPAPNQYAAEGFPMLAAFGRFQKWDGLFTFTYSHNREFEPRQLTGYFDIKADTAKLAHQFACAAMFLRGDVQQAKRVVDADLPPDSERKMLHETPSAWTLTADRLGVPRSTAMRHAVAVDLDPEATPQDLQLPGESSRITSDTGQLHWDFSRPDAGTFIVDTPRTKVFTGFVRGRTFSLGDIRLEIGQTRLDWATITLTGVDGQDGQNLCSPGRILLAATGEVRNTGAKIENLGGERITLRNRWGQPPLLCEGIPAQLTLPVDADRVRLYALDESGDRQDSIPVVSRGKRALVTIGPEHKTVWYEIEVLPCK